MKASGFAGGLLRFAFALGIPFQINFVSVMNEPVDGGASVVAVIQDFE